VFERALRLDPSHLPALFALGVTLARQRHYPQAVAAWDRVVGLAPTGPLAAQARQHSRSARDLAAIFSPAAVG
ncbi:MAG: tetratricopeptide repeat protein, partial [Gemmatimonadota bacterium]